MQMFKRAALCGLISATLFTAAAISPANALSYTDTGSTWAKEVIEKAADYHLLGGYPDGSFGVGKPITRAEFTTVVVRMMGWDLTSAPDPGYPDCSGHWAAGSIAAAAAHNVMDPGGTFRPDVPILRGEMAEMLVRAMGYQELAASRSTAPLPFADLPQGNGYISVAYDLDIINGMTENGQPVFAADRTAVREQAAAMLVRCYERWTDTTDWLHGFYAMSSYSQLDYGAAMNAVSAGWARLEPGSGGGVILNGTSSGGNSFAKPAGSELVQERLAQAQVPLNLCVFSSPETFALLEDPASRQQAITLLTTAAEEYSGLTLDFEGLKTERREDFTSFVSELRSTLPEKKSLFVCVQPSQWFGGYDYRALGELCDKVILMAHDYQWASIPDYYLGTANTYCPVTPYEKVYAALQEFTDPRTGVADLSRTALALSFNTTGFHVDAEGRILDQTFYHPSRDTIRKRLKQPDSVRTWDSRSRNPSLSYTDEAGEHYLLWYEDGQSVADKLQLARMFGVTGVSVWRLGVIPDFSDADHYDVWSVLSPDSVLEG